MRTNKQNKKDETDLKKTLETLKTLRENLLEIKQKLKTAIKNNKV